MSSTDWATETRGGKGSKPPAITAIRPHCDVNLPTATVEATGRGRGCRRSDGSTSCFNNAGREPASLPDKDGRHGTLPAFDRLVNINIRGGPSMASSTRFLKQFKAQGEGRQRS